MVNKYKNLTNKKFGKLTLLYPLDTIENSLTVWVCKCDCGNYTRAGSCDVLMGKRTTCGCANKPVEPIINFEKHFEMCRPWECWEWKANKLPSGYGQWQISHAKYQKHWLAHRFSYQYYKNDILEEDDVVCHTCDNPSCVNPEHLFKGKQKDNIEDKINKGRQLCGSRVPNSKLCENDIITIRKLLKENELKQTKIAKLFNVSDSRITEIKKGRGWRHVN